MSAAMRRRVGALLLAIGTSHALTACNQIVPPRDLKAPSLSIAGIGIETITRDSLKLRVLIDARNPNPVEMPLSDFKFDLSLLGQKVANGVVAEQSFTLPAQGERQVPLILTLAGSDALGVLRRSITGVYAEVQWELKGSARWGITPIPLPFEKRGSLGLRTVLDALAR
jgi:LEA14-like dessication related protein